MKHEWYVPEGWAGRVCYNCKVAEFNGKEMIKTECNPPAAKPGATFLEWSKAVSKYE